MQYVLLEKVLKFFNTYNLENLEILHYEQLKKSWNFAIRTTGKSFKIMQYVQLEKVLKIMQYAHLEKA